MRHKAHLQGKRMAPQYSVPFGQVQTIPARLGAPARWKRPLKIFVDSVSDLFHEQVPFSFIAEVFDAMAMADWHTYQVLTKRIDRALQFFLWYQSRSVVEGGVRVGDRAPITFEAAFRHVHLGVSVENQDAAERRVPLLLAAPFAVRWLSCEPLLGHVDLSRWIRYLQWVVSGGESGRAFRALNLDHARSLRDQCIAAGVPYLFKQVGGHTPKAGGRLLDGVEWDQFPEVTSVG
jgi:protein gp37